VSSATFLSFVALSSEGWAVELKLSCRDSPSSAPTLRLRVLRCEAPDEAAGGVGVSSLPP